MLLCISVSSNDNDQLKSIMSDILGIDGAKSGKSTPRNPTSRSGIRFNPDGSKHKKSKSKSSISEWSDAETTKSESIGDMMKEFENIVEGKPAKKTKKSPRKSQKSDSLEASVAADSKRSSAKGDEVGVEGLVSLLRKEFKRSDNFFGAKVSDDVEPMVTEKGSGSNRKERPPSISSFDDTESVFAKSPEPVKGNTNKQSTAQGSKVVTYTVPEPIEGLSSLCKKEFSRNPNEFFVSSLRENNDQPIDKSRKPSSTTKSPELSNVVKYTVPEPIEGLSSLCKKEFSRNPNEFFVSSLNDNQASSSKRGSSNDF